MNRSLILLFVFVISGLGFLHSQSKINGLSFVSSGNKVLPKHVQSVEAVNANWVALMPFAMMRSTASPGLNYTPERQWYGETEAGIQQYFEQLQKGNIQVGIITGRMSSLLQRRADELGISPVIQGREDKLTALNELLPSLDITLDEIAFIGDDLPDLAVIKRVGLGITVANASSTLAAEASWQTVSTGGNGAVREVAEMILIAQEKFSKIVGQYQ